MMTLDLARTKLDKYGEMSLERTQSAKSALSDLVWLEW